MVLLRSTGRPIAEHVHSTVRPDGVECLEATYHTHMFERHMHDTLAIGVTLSGVQRFWCEGVTHDSCAGDVMVIEPGQAHDGESGTEGPYSYRMAYLPRRVVQDVLADASERPCEADLWADATVLHDRRLAAKVLQAWSSAHTAPTHDALVDAFYEPVHDLAVRFRRLAASEPPRCAAAELARVADYLHAHIGREVSTSELARLAGMSRFRLTREFTRVFGLPLHAYHLHVRLEASKRLLLTGEPIAGIAAQLGFCDQSHFHRRFKGAFGLTPAQWRHAISTP